jgi:hypothetical protein
MTSFDQIGVTCDNQAITHIVIGTQSVTMAPSLIWRKLITLGAVCGQYEYLLVVRVTKQARYIYTAILRK